MEDLEIRDDERESKFVADLEHGQAYVAYNELPDGRLDLRSTWVPPEERGRGVGERLVLHALDRAREAGRRVIPTCPFVGWVVERHPEYGELLDEA